MCFQHSYKGWSSASHRKGEALDCLQGISEIYKDIKIAMEVFNFIDGKNLLLDIRNTVMAEYDYSSLEEIKKFLNALSKAGIFDFK